MGTTKRRVNIIKRQLSRAKLRHETTSFPLSLLLCLWKIRGLLSRGFSSCQRSIKRTGPRVKSRYSINIAVNTENAGGGWWYGSTANLLPRRRFTNAYVGLAFILKRAATCRSLLVADAAVILAATDGIKSNMHLRIKLDFQVSFHGIGMLVKKKKKKEKKTCTSQ